MKYKKVTRKLKLLNKIIAVFKLRASKPYHFLSLNEHFLNL